MYRPSTSHGTSPRIGIVSILAASLALAVGCGETPPPCDPCPSIGGTYVIETASTTGECDFTPMLIDGSLVLAQEPDDRGSEVLTHITDPVTVKQFFISGDVLEPASRDPDDAIAGLAMNAETVRQATQLEPRLVTLLIHLGGTIQEDEEGEIRLSGSLTTTDISSPPPGAEEMIASCNVTVSFSAVLVDD